MNRLHTTSVSVPSDMHHVEVPSCDNSSVLLVKECLSGCPKAWSNFLKKFDSSVRGAVAKTFARYGGAPADVDDVVQDVYCRLVRGSYRLLATWDCNRGSLSTWLIVVSRSTAIDHLRTKKTTHTTDDTIVLEDSLLFSHEHEHIDEETLQIPHGILSPRQYSVVQLLVDKEMNTEEVARELDIHPQTVRSVWHLSVAKLKKYFENEKMYM